ncbi:hypothetical protein EI94DRAFT_1872812 [Lactarius quietus]|nr:hypothetical protein EI94DRAFT_1872812 [Lactarius quietus]
MLNVICQRLQSLPSKGSHGLLLASDKSGVGGCETGSLRNLPSMNTDAFRTYLKGGDGIQSLLSDEKMGLMDVEVERVEPKVQVECWTLKNKKLYFPSLTLLPNSRWLTFLPAPREQFTALTIPAVEYTSMDVSYGCAQTSSKRSFIPIKHRKRREGSWDECRKLQEIETPRSSVSSSSQWRAIYFSSSNLVEAILSLAGSLTPSFIRSFMACTPATCPTPLAYAQSWLSSSASGSASGKWEADQLYKITEVLGDPCENHGTDEGGVQMVRDNFGFMFQKIPLKDIASLFDRSVPSRFIECIADLLKYNPAPRLTSFECHRRDHILPALFMSTSLLGHRSGLSPPFLNSQVYCVLSGHLPPT